MPRQNHRRVLPTRPTEAEKRERTLRLAFTNAPSALGCRPEPRGRFDKPASDETRRPWRGFAEPLRDTAIEARRHGGDVRARTEELLVAAVAALLDYVLEPLDETTGALAYPVLYPVLAKEQGEAIDAQAVAHMLPTPENVARADAETADAIAAARFYRAALQSTVRRSMGATPRGVA